MSDRPPGLRDRPLVFVEDLDDPWLDDDDHHHFERVLRIEVGEPITLGDGRGRWREARFGRRPALVTDVGVVEPPARALTVAFSPVKGERPEWFVQKLTELGIDEIVPLLTERTVVRWDEARAAKQHERMVKVGREACLQSRRLHLPTIAPQTSLEDLLIARPETVLADPDGRPLGRDHLVIAVGPEGGFSAAERSTAETVALPGHVLRAGTAALTAAAMACGLRAGMISRTG